MKTDIEIANSVKLKTIKEVAEKIGIGENELYLYGNFMAKVNAKNNIKAKIILVTAINPTAAGEGKTTVSIGLADALNSIGKKTALALREPSLGPVFGIKGGAAGGGFAQIAPMQDINLHFTGDFHAITAANNLLSAMIDNHIYWGNSLHIKKVLWRRCQDVNDRALRNIISGIGYNIREDGFDITAASEIMAIAALSADAEDLKKRLGDIIVAQNENNDFIKAKDIKAQEAMAILLKDAIKPNLAQTLEGNPVFVHAGPFANIAHGCNSIIATKTAASYADFVVTEAGFGADLGAEKFLDIKCRAAGIAPSAVVIVATIRALKNAGGASKENLSKPDVQALKKGLPNLIKHIENIKGVYNLPCIVAINKFETDTESEIKILKEECKKMGVGVSLTDVWAYGSKGGVELAEEVLKLCQIKSELKFSYELDDSPQVKIEKISKRIYGARSVIFLPKAIKVLESIKGTAFEKYPVCIAKTQYSLSDNPALTGRPENFDITVRDILIRGGAGFLAALAGDIMLMPGLGRVPVAEKMSISSEGEIKGLF
ncbi:MAG: formate--tetrahydrofolate ligase [Elusimicrobiota bacterium]|jgi:formate--tetrahydrofolate ligase|nr:formate--tetrahydrofolate ligase [Elusimicrobiota bacterium]